MATFSWENFKTLPNYAAPSNFTQQAMATFSPQQMAALKQIWDGNPAIHSDPHVAQVAAQLGPEAAVAFWQSYVGTPQSRAFIEQVGGIPADQGAPGGLGSIVAPTAPAAPIAPAAPAAPLPVGAPGTTPIDPNTQSTLARQIAEDESKRAWQLQNFQIAQAFSNLAGNPRNFAQSAYMAGLDPKELFSKSPLFQSLLNGTGDQYGRQTSVGLNSPSASSFGPVPGQDPQVSAGMGMNESAGQPQTTPFDSMTADFGGANLPGRRTLFDINTSSQELPLIGSWFSLMGKDPATEMAAFQNYLPKGKPIGATSF